MPRTQVFGEEEEVWIQLAEDVKEPMDEGEHHLA